MRYIAFAGAFVAGVAWLVTLSVAEAIRAEALQSGSDLGVIGGIALAVVSSLAALVVLPRTSRFTAAVVASTMLLGLLIGLIGYSLPTAAAAPVELTDFSTIFSRAAGSLSAWVATCVAGVMILPRHAPAPAGREPDATGAPERSG